MGVVELLLSRRRGRGRGRLERVQRRVRVGLLETVVLRTWGGRVGGGGARDELERIYVRDIETRYNRGRRVGIGIGRLRLRVDIVDVLYLGLQCGRIVFGHRGCVGSGGVHLAACVVLRGFYRFVFSSDLGRKCRK